MFGKKMKDMFPVVTNTTTTTILMTFLKTKQLTECLPWKFLKEFRECLGEVSIELQ